MFGSRRSPVLDHTPDGELEDHDRGLSHDLPTLLSRRRALSLFGGASLVALPAGRTPRTARTA